jgi:hypothetical protein
MGEFDLLARAREDDAMIAHDVTTPHNAEANGTDRPGAGLAVPRIERGLLEGRAASRRYRAADA